MPRLPGRLQPLAGKRRFFGLAREHPIRTLSHILRSAADKERHDWQQDQPDHQGVDAPRRAPTEVLDQQVVCQGHEGQAERTAEGDETQGAAAASLEPLRGESAAGKQQTADAKAAEERVAEGEAQGAGDGAHDQEGAAEANGGGGEHGPVPKAIEHAPEEHDGQGANEGGNSVRR